MPQEKNNPNNPPLEYRNFRVRTPVKSFRDLEVYRYSTKLAADIFNLDLPTGFKKNQSLKDEVDILKNISKHIPRLIAESYGEKFSNLNQACITLEKSAQTISLIISKIDFLNALIDDSEFKEKTGNILKKYQVTRLKILNLKKAWEIIINRPRQMSPI